MERDKSKLLVGLTLILVGVALLAWIFVSKQAAAPSSDDKVQDVSTEAVTENTEPIDEYDEEQPVSDTVTISFTKDGFSPAELTVKKGTIVRVLNESSSRVQFSSDDHPTHRINQGMNLPVLAAGESGTFVADEVGEWGFHDHIDASFTGMIAVTE